MESTDGDGQIGALSAATSPLVRRLAGVDAAAGAPGSGRLASKQSEQPKKSPWLDAFNDPVAGISAYTPCVHTCNLFGDGDWRLVVADSDKKLKVGTSCSPMVATGGVGQLHDSRRRVDVLHGRTGAGLARHSEAVRARAAGHAGGHHQLCV